MASITQTIPNFFGGISEVPDSQKGQGQVNDALNCIPDLNRGLYKRPGARRVGSSALTGATADGVWFHYYRDEQEGSYIGQVATNGHVTMWDADTGAEITVNHDSGTESYLTHSGGEQLQFTTINDSTFVCNRNQVTSMTSATTDLRPHTYSAFVELKRVQNGRQYGLNIHDPTSHTSTQISTATLLSVECTTTEGFTTFSGSNGHCPNIGTQVFDESNPAGNEYNLVFRLTTTGQQGPVPGSNDDSPEDNDFTCSYSTTVDLLHGGRGWNNQSTRTVNMAGRSYTVSVERSETVSVRASIKAVRPAPTPFDAQTNVSVDSILGGIRDELVGTGINHIMIGNGIYLYSNTVNFTVEAQNTDLMTVITDQVNDVTGLPFQCKHNYIVKVANSSAAEDDYYLKFVGNGNTSGPGSWVECAEPGIQKEINDATLPIIIQRQSNGNFRVKKFSYSDREVGDDNTNPVPSFVGKTINKVVFFRNRLAFLSDENIILSRPGDLGNFFVNTALTVSGTDPIDISSSSKYPGILFDAIEINTGLLIFGEKQQFLLATDSDILNPESARLSSISTYNYNTSVPPFSLGTTAGFLDNAGAHSRFFVMSNVAREGEPNVNELSKTVSRKLSKEIDLLANSRENTSIFFGKTNSDEVFGYKYFNVADKQLQSSWFRWKFPRPIRYHCVVNDSYIIVDNQNFLQRIDLIRDDESTVTEHGNEYLVHLDNYSTATGTYDISTRVTNFNLSWIADVDDSVDLVAIKPGESGIIHQTVDVPESGTTVSLSGDWSSGPTVFGYNYSMEVKLPKFFVQKVTGEKTVNEERGSLVIHRVKPLFGRLGQYQSVVTRVGKLDFTKDFFSSTYDQYLYGDVIVEDEYQGVVPVYEKNTNFTLTIKSTSPLPATLISLTWEGDYSPKYYKNV
jgi:hypothetical protein|tara:strand:- start:340 stop:3066 length:2727 start_codon:yes stop_codon:yes gene_type:complete